MADWSKHSRAIQVIDSARRGRRGWIALTLLLGPVLLVLGYAVATGEPEPDWSVPLAAIAAVAGLVMLARATGAWDAPRPGSLAQRGPDLIVEIEGSSWRARREAFRSGWITPGPRSPSVELQHRDGTRWRIAVQDESEGEALLDRLRLSRRFVRATAGVGPEAPLGSRLGLAALLTFVVNLLTVDRWPVSWRRPPGGLAMTVGVMALCSVALLLWRPRRLTIGNDGMHWRGRFIAATDIAAVHQRRAQVCVELADGALLRLRLPPWAHDRAGAIASRLQRLRQRVAECETPPAGAGALARGGREVARWLSDLAALLDGGGDYRRAPISAEDAECVLRSCRASSALRLAAAVALTRGGTALECAKLLRNAARASADPALRKLLRGLSAGRLTGPRLTATVGTLGPAG